MLSHYVLPDHPVIREAEAYGWPLGFEDMQDDELLMLIDDDFEVEEYVDIAGSSGAEI